MTFKKAYTDIFSEYLKKLGFVCDKSGRFFRLINGEIIQFIKYRASRPTVKGHRGFTTKAGMVSIYCQSLDDDRLEFISSDVYYWAGRIYGDEKTRTMPVEYEYTNENMQEILGLALEHTKEIILPLFNEVYDLDSYIYKYALPIKRSNISGADKFAADSLVLIMADDHGNFREQLERDYAETESILTLQNRLEILDQQRSLLYDAIVNNIAVPRDRVFADAELYAGALKEAERRKEANMQGTIKNLQLNNIIKKL